MSVHYFASCLRAHKKKATKCGQFKDSYLFWRRGSLAISSTVLSNRYPKPLGVLDERRPPLATSMQPLVTSIRSTWLACLRGFRVLGLSLGFGIKGLGFRIKGLRFRIKGLRFTVYGLRFTVYGLRFTGLGFGLKV